MRDYRFHCEDCDSYRECAYYRGRKGTSLICKEFQYGSSVIEQIRTEIEQTADNYNPMRDAFNCGYVMAIKDVLQIVAKYL